MGMSSYNDGRRQGIREAQRMIDVGPESTRGHSENMRITPEDMPPPDQLPMSRAIRRDWLTGFADGIRTALGETL